MAETLLDDEVATMRRLTIRLIDLLLSPRAQVCWLLLILLAGCQSWTPAQQYRCPHHLPVGYGLDVPVTYLSHREIAERCETWPVIGCVDQWEYNGVTHRHIFIHAEASQITRAETIHHERCHLWEVESGLATWEQSSQHLGWQRW